MFIGRTHSESTEIVPVKNRKIFFSQSLYPLRYSTRKIFYCVTTVTTEYSRGFTMHFIVTTQRVRSSLTSVTLYVLHDFDL